MDFCSTIYDIKFAFEYYEESLGDELRRRRRLPAEEEIDKYMSEPEIWYI